MDPMNSIWYYLEFQRQFSAAKRSSSEPFAKPESRPNKLAKVWLVEPPLALFLFAALVTFGLACFLCPRFLTQNSARACADVVLQTFRRPELQSIARALRSFLERDSSGSAQRFEELFLPQLDAACNLAEPTDPLPSEAELKARFEKLDQQLNKTYAKVIFFEAAPVPWQTWDPEYVRVEFVQHGGM